MRLLHLRSEAQPRGQMPRTTSIFPRSLNRQKTESILAMCLQKSSMIVAAIFVRVSRDQFPEGPVIIMSSSVRERTLLDSEFINLYTERSGAQNTSLHAGHATNPTLFFVLRRVQRCTNFRFLLEGDASLSGQILQIPCCI